MRGWLDARLAPEVPAARLAVIRALVGLFALVYLSIRFVHLLRYRDFPAAQFAPTGIVTLISTPLSAWWVVAQVVVTWLLSITFMLGLWHRVLGPCFALALLWTLSYRSSWGMIFHTENLLVLHTIVLAFAPAADTFALRKPLSDQRGARYGLPIRLMCLISVLAYFVAGWAKLRNAGWEWAGGDILQVQVAYDNLRKLALGDYYSPLGAYLVRFGALWAPLAAVSLVMELLAPLAFLGERAGRWWSLAAFSFHLGVLALMAINFPYPLSFVAFASFFAAERLPPLLAARLGRRFPSLRFHSGASSQ